jgi:glycosyltransferase involved in cell wall biosynthesis
MQSSEPLVSVIIPVRNEQGCVGTALASILNQSYRRLEVVVVDDCSEDRSAAICRGFLDPRVHVHSVTGGPLGAAAVRNTGIRLARGEYIANQDADDWSRPERIETQLAAALDAPGRRVVGTAIEHRIGALRRDWVMPRSHEQIVLGFRRLVNRTTFVAGTMLAPADLLRRIPYRPRFRFHEDWDLLLRLSESRLVEFYNCPEVLYTYRISGKCSVNDPEWVRYNLFVRASQLRRARGLSEYPTIGEWESALGDGWGRAYWSALGWLIDKRLNRTHRRHLTVLAPSDEAGPVRRSGLSPTESLERLDRLARAECSSADSLSSVQAP